MYLHIKQRFCFCIFCLFLPAVLFSQQGRIIRSGKIDYLFTNRLSLYSPGRADVIDTGNLYFNDTASSYYMHQRIPSKEEILKQADGKPASSRTSYLSIWERMKEKQKRHFIFHKAGSNVLSQPWSSPMGDEWYCIQDTVQALQWTLSPDTTRILGFTCQKAVFRSAALGSIEREFVAWFAPELAYAYGPFRFFGLPGMILQLDNKYYSYKAVAIDIPLSEEGKFPISCCSGLPAISKAQSDKIKTRQVTDVENMKKLKSDKN